MQCGCSGSELQVTPTKKGWNIPDSATLKPIYTIWIYLISNVAVLLQYLVVTSPAPEPNFWLGRGLITGAREFFHENGASRALQSSSSRRQCSLASVNGAAESSVFRLWSWVHSSLHNQNSPGKTFRFHRGVFPPNLMLLPGVFPPTTSLACLVLVSPGAPWIVEPLFGSSESPRWSGGDRTVPPSAFPWRFKPEMLGKIQWPFSCSTTVLLTQMIYIMTLAKIGQSHTP